VRAKKIPKILEKPSLPQVNPYQLFQEKSPLVYGFAPKHPTVFELVADRSLLIVLVCF